MRKSRNIARQFEDDDDEEVFQKLYKINTSREAVENIKYMAHILMPLIEAYAITGFTLETLVQRQLLESELVASVLKEMKEQLATGSLNYGKQISEGEFGDLRAGLCR